MKRSTASRIQLALVAAAAGGAIGVAAAGPAGASTVGLLKASQLPTGYKAIGHPVTISGSSILKGTQKLGGGVAGATAACKGTPSASSLKGYTAHVVAFEKSASVGSVGVLGEVVLQAPSVDDARSFFAAVKSATASCAGTRTLSMDGVSLTVHFSSRNANIDKAGADEAVGTVVSLAANTTAHGIAATAKGALGLQTYRSGAEVVEVIVDNFGVKADLASGAASVTFSPGSTSLVTSVGKAAIQDL